MVGVKQLCAYRREPSNHARRPRSLQLQNRTALESIQKYLLPILSLSQPYEMRGGLGGGGHAGGNY